MNIGSNEIEEIPTIRTLAHLRAAIRRLLIAQMGAEAAAPHLIKLAHLIFLLSIYFGRRPERIRVWRVFGVDVRDIARRTGVPTSPQLVIEMSSALDMLRTQPHERPLHNSTHTHPRQKVDPL